MIKAVKKLFFSNTTRLKHIKKTKELLDAV